MKLSTIFMLAVALALFYCWTADGHSNAGKRENRRPLQKKNHHKGHHPDNITIQRKDDGKKFECKCVLRNPHQSQRERHQMNELQKRHLHGRKCHCKSLVKKPESSIPLS
ncbi:uncharacterized protein LOC143934019 [Lithobates pipiens]